MSQASRWFAGVLMSLLISSVVYAQPVRLGIDVLRDSQFEILQGKRVGLVAHPASVDSLFESTVQILKQAQNVNLVALFGPEHGVYGDVYAGDEIANRVDPRTGLPVYSLYGSNRKPTEAMLDGIDVLVFDLQDIGARSYTYISTMRACMEACSEQGKRFVVLDRPNPLGGDRIEGGFVEEGYESFVSDINVPYVHGMTMGELAMLVRDRYLPDYNKLTVIKIEGWHRSMQWKDTGLKWVITSPHIPHAETCAYYVATGIVGELDTITNGVGYTQPFELFGSPDINGEALADALNKHWNNPGKAYQAISKGMKIALPESHPPLGLMFRPTWFKPFYGRFQGKVCQGVQVHVDPDKNVNLVEINFRLAQALGGEYIFGDGSREHAFDIAIGTNEARLVLTQDTPIDGLFARWRQQCEQFRKDRQKYLLYP